MRHNRDEESEKKQKEIKVNIIRKNHSLTLEQSRISSDSSILAKGAKIQIFAAIKKVNVNSWQRESYTRFLFD
jgi:hypothetical protein